MLSAVASGLLTGAIAYLAALGVAVVVRRLLHHERTKVYRWGVGAFALLVGVYSIITSLGRS